MALFTAPPLRGLLLHFCALGLAFSAAAPAQTLNARDQALFP